MSISNDIIYLQDLKKDLKIKDKAKDKYDIFKDKIISLAFSMSDEYKPSNSEKDILRVANDMGFFVDNEIHFDSTRPDSEANSIMDRINKFKNDIINNVNEAINRFKDNYDGNNEIKIIINLETLLDKYDISSLQFHKDYYSLQWLKNKLHIAGYDYSFKCIGDNYDCLVYRIYLTWD